MSRTDDFRAAIRQAELDRALDGTWLIYLEILLIALAVGSTLHSVFAGVLVLISLLVALALVPHSPRAASITLSAVYVFYTVVITALFVSSFWTTANTLGQHVGQIIGFLLLSGFLGLIPTALHDSAFRTQRDISREE